MHLRITGRIGRAFGLAAALAAGPAAAGKPPAAPPTFTLPAKGGTVCLDSLRGKLVLVDFWASWCGPCHQSFPWMKTMAEKYRDRGFEVVAVSLDKTRDAADGFLASHPAPFTIAYDTTGRTAAAWHVAGMPSTYLVGRKGEILWSHVGFEAGKTGPIEALIAENCKP